MPGRERVGDGVQRESRNSHRALDGAQREPSERLREVEKFAAQLDEARAGRSAAHIREMAELTRKIDDCLRKALAALEDAEA